MSIAASRRLFPKGFAVNGLAAEPDGLRISAAAEAKRASCPTCGHGSARVHSRYGRTVVDLPWRGLTVTLQVRARKFFCDEASCERRIFCERLPEISVRARKTDRLEESLLSIVLELGGRAGARLATELGLLAGRDALLDRVKKIHPVSNENVTVLGIDDFGFRRGNASGTIMVDLERHEVVDLVRGHSTELIAKWLRRHPNLEVVARDRSNVCREGIDAGAPEAKQIADRRHLLKNLTEVLQEYLLAKRPALKKAVAPETGVESEDDSEEDHASSVEAPLQRPYESIENRPENATKVSSSSGKRSAGCILQGLGYRT